MTQALSLADCLKNKNCLITDCAMGTELFVRGMPTGEAPERLNLSEPEKILGIHSDCIAAGSDIVLTNSFGGNVRRLKLHQLDDQVEEISVNAAKIARRAADRSDRPVLVAGAVGPTGDLLEPVGPLSIDEASDIFEVQQRALIEGGADLVWIETISSKQEAQAAMRAAKRVGCPYALTMSFDTAGHTMMGFSASDFHALVTQEDFSPVAIGLNCGTGASDLLGSLLKLTEHKFDVPLIAKSNAGIPQISGDRVYYSGSVELMADYAKLAFAAGARIIGGCCGTSPAHIAAISASLSERLSAIRPSLEHVCEVLGPLTQARAKNKKRSSHRP